jgi:hypothetical protein
MACILSRIRRPLDEPKGEKARAAAALEHGRQDVSAWTIRAAGRGGDEFRPMREPILKWSNPIRGSLYGDVDIWTLKGRPEVVWSYLES